MFLFLLRLVALDHAVLSPSDGEQEPLKAGDLIKIELGCHVDYYSAVVAHTVKVSWGCWRCGESKRESSVIVLPVARVGFCSRPFFVLVGASSGASSSSKAGAKRTSFFFFSWPPHSEGAPAGLLSHDNRDTLLPYLR